AHPQLHDLPGRGCSRGKDEREPDRGADRGPEPGATEHQSSSAASFTACPPNWFRSAAFTLAANDSSWRDAKRAKRDIVMIGAGTSSSIAESTVQRPSPES